MLNIKNCNNFYKKHFSTLIIIFVFLLVISVIGVTFSIFTWTSTGNTGNVVSTGSVTFSYSESTNGILITNSLPISDAVGKTLQSGSEAGVVQGFFDFTLSATVVGNVAVNYEIYTDKQEVANEIDPEYIKIYLTNGDKEEAYDGYDLVSVPTYSSLPVSASDPSAKRLYAGTFTSTGSHDFRLRMWLADVYAVSAGTKSFEMKVNVAAMQ